MMSSDKEINTIIYREFPYMMVKKTFEDGSISIDTKYDDNLMIKDALIKIKYLHNEKPVGTSSSGVKVRKVLGEPNYIIVNSEELFKIQKIKKNIIYFNCSKKINTISQIYIETNLKNMFMDNGLIKFRDQSYDAVEIDSSGIDLDYIIYSLKETW